MKAEDLGGLGAPETKEGKGKGRGREGHFSVAFTVVPTHNGSPEETEAG